MLSMTVEPSPPAIVTDEVYENLGDANAEGSDWTYDPNEPRYCVCNQVSYGDMVACDNEDVSSYALENVVIPTYFMQDS
jgi:hypothetical protein